MTTNLARLTNTGVNIVGGTTSLTTTYGPTSILVAGNNFDVSSSGTLTMGSTGNVTIGNTGSGAITRFNAPITLGPAPTTGNHLGGFKDSTFERYTSPGNLAYVTLSTGSWILFASVFFPTNTFREVSISATTSIDVNSTNGGAGASTVSHSRAVVVTSGFPSYYLVAASTPAVTTQNVNLYAIRVG